MSADGEPITVCRLPVEVEPGLEDEALEAGLAGDDVELSDADRAVRRRQDDSGRSPPSVVTCAASGES